MTLAVSSKHSLAHLEQWVSSKFAPVINKEVTLPDLGSPTPYPSEKLGTLVKWVPVLDKDVMVFKWVLPYCEKDHNSMPLEYFSHLLGHEGRNSLLSYLVQQDLALELECGADHELWSYSLLNLNVLLTKKGLAHYEDVAEAVFKYLHKLRDAGPQEFVHQECHDLGKVQFRFADNGSPMQTCVNLSTRMQKFDH